MDLWNGRRATWLMIIMESGMNLKVSDCSSIVCYMGDRLSPALFELLSVAGESRLDL